MCVVSMVTDHFLTKPNWQDHLQQQTTTFHLPPTRAEFEALKKEVQEMISLIKRAKIYDEQNGQPHCENEHKIEMVKKIADLVGIDIQEVVDALK